MTVASETPINTYTANGSTTIFAFNFRVEEESELKVYIDNVEQTSGYSVSGVGVNGGGSITFTSSPDANSIVVLIRDMPSTRTTDYQNSGDFRADTVDQDFDRLWLKIQEIEREVNYRTLQFIGEGVRTPAINVLPSSSAGSLLAWQADGSLGNTSLSINTSDEAFSVFNYATLQSLDTSGFANGLTVQIGGRLTVNDGGEGAFVWHTADLSSSVSNDANQGIYVPPASDVTGASGCWVRARAFPFNLKWFNARGDGITDDTSAIEAAIAYAASVAPEGAYIYAPPAIYRFTRDITLTSRVTIFGDGLGQASAASQSNAPTIFFKDGTGFTYGFDLQAYSSLEGCQVLGDCVVEEFTASASQTVFTLATTTYTVGAGNIKVSIQNVAIPATEYTQTNNTTITLNSTISGGNGEVSVPFSGGEKVVITVYKNDGDGVTFRGRGAQVINVASTGHEGKGFRVGDSLGTNANLWRANNLVARDNGSHGFYNKGAVGTPDTNVGVLISFDGRDNGGDNIALEDTIDNTFINVHTFGAAGQGVRLYGGAKGNTFTTPYTENDFAGHGQIDSGAERNFVFGQQQGGSPWTINDENNYFLSPGGSEPHLDTRLRFLSGIILNSAGVDPDYKMSAADGYQLNETTIGGLSNIIRYFTADGDGTDNVIEEIYGVGTSSDSTNRERMQLGFIAADNEFVVRSNAGGTGVVRDLRMGAGDTDTNEITFQSNDVMLNLPDGLGDGSSANLTAPAQGSGDGPASLAAAKWVRVKFQGDGQRYWIPLYQ